jgi:hypothetical protein
MPEKNLFSYLLDHWYSLVRFDPAFLRPVVMRGYFEAHAQGYLQEVFFHELLRQGFKRTVWQLVLPGQTAGLVYKVVVPESEVLYQYHVRFYSDGTIDCELEPHNWSMHHLSGTRSVDATLLAPFLHKSKLRTDERDAIEKLFETKEHNWHAIRRAENQSILR